MHLTIKQKTTLATPRSLLEVKDLQHLGKEAVNCIVDRVQERGSDATGAPMAGYTAAYAKQKRKKGGVTSRRDLTVTGRFLKSLRYWGATKHKVVIGFTSGYGRTLAEAHQRRSNFLGLSPRDRKDVLFELESVLEKRLKTLKIIK